MRKLHVAAFVATLFVAAGIAPSFADGSAVNVAAVKATIASGTATLATSGTQVAADFGQPPSGEIPILYNDHHVYANPSILRQNRTLGALIKNGVDTQMQEGFLAEDMPYDVENYLVEYALRIPHVPVSFWETPP